MHSKVVKKKRYNLLSIFAWLYLYTIGLFLPKKWNLWAKKIINNKSNKKKDDPSNQNQEKIDQFNEPTNLKKNTDTHDSGISLNSYSEYVSQDELEYDEYNISHDENTYKEIEDTFYWKNQVENILFKQNDELTKENADLKNELAKITRENALLKAKIPSTSVKITEKVENSQSLRI